MHGTHLTPKCRLNNIVVKNIENEVLVYDLRSNKAFCLNETSAEVWQECDGKKTIEEITFEISRNHNFSISPDLVKLAITELAKDNLLETDKALLKLLEGFSRRDLIRKLALTSLIALPLVTSLVAPTALAAQSFTCPASPCRCTNGTATSCNGSTSGIFVNCLNVSGGISNCNCVGPFGPDDSAGTGYKTGIGCRVE